jgi:hypothetical protein
VICGILAAILQLGEVLYSLAKTGSIGLKDHLYYSPAALLLLTTAGAALLVLPDNRVKLISYLLLLALCTTTKHASIFLALLTVGFSYAFLIATPQTRLFIAGFSLICLIILLLKVDQFQDINARWRLLFWKHTLSEAITDRYAILGKGFGVPYADTEAEMYLWRETTSAAFVDNGDPRFERYFSSMHNSFITIMFAIGILPGMLVLAPFLLMIRRSITFGFTAMRLKEQFLMLSLIGASIWASFNMVLELPHSSGFFWLIYFSYWLVALEES